MIRGYQVWINFLTGNSDSGLDFQDLTLFHLQSYACTISGVKNSAKL
jgi:hypothetical protein